MLDTAIRLHLFIGDNVPLPAPQAVMDALVDIEIQNRDSGRDGFQMTFTLGRDRSPADYVLLRNRYLEPERRVIVMMMIKGIPEVLIDGMITQHQVTPSMTPGGARLSITGEDISLKLDLEEKRQPHPNQSDSTIVTRILMQYAQYGLIPKVTTTNDTPSESQRRPSQDGTDLSYIQSLAQRNSYVFYVEPVTLGVNTAYWGPDTRQGKPQPTLSMNMGPYTNVESINFGFDSLAPSEPSVSVLESQSRSSIRVPTPPSLRAPLAAQPTRAIRRTLPQGTAGLSMTQAGLRAQSAANQNSDSVTGSGELDTLRYGRVLRARGLVGVRGVGYGYDGSYYVKQVTHRISREQYRQSFSLLREGRGSTLSTVVTR
jgi:hypothetical protein